MLTITPREALRGAEYCVVERETRFVCDRYPEEDIARRICRDLNKRYGERYAVAGIDYGEGI